MLIAAHRLILLFLCLNPFHLRILLPSLGLYDLWVWIVWSFHVSQSRLNIFIALKRLIINLKAGLPRNHLLFFRKAGKLLNIIDMLLIILLLHPAMSKEISLILPDHTNLNFFGLILIIWISVVIRILFLDLIWFSLLLWVKSYHRGHLLLFWIEENLVPPQSFLKMVRFFRSDGVYQLTVATLIDVMESKRYQILRFHSFERVNY